jgi:hypothetical protein
VGRHFVVVERLRGGRLEIFDPCSGTLLSWTPEQLFRWGGGWVLAVTP